jgi:hypothetical protein
VQIILGNRLAFVLNLMLAFPTAFIHSDSCCRLDRLYFRPSSWERSLCGFPMPRKHSSPAEVFFSCEPVPNSYQSILLIGLPSSLLFAALSSMAEIPALFSQRPIVLRHQKAALYHPFIEALALTLVDVPITFVTTVSFTLILYFLVGLQQSAGQFLYVVPVSSSPSCPRPHSIAPLPPPSASSIYSSSRFRSP